MEKQIQSFPKIRFFRETQPHLFVVGVFLPRLWVFAFVEG